MRGRRKHALAIVITLGAAGLSFMGATAGTASAAEGCLTSPKMPAPEGGRWYYRLDHANNKRKCWHLVMKDGARETVKSVNAPAAKRVAAPAASAPEPQDPQKLVTRDVSSTNDESNVAPSDALVIVPLEDQAPAMAPEQQATMAPAAQVQAPIDAPEVRSPTERAAPRPGKAAAAEPAPTSVMQYAFLVLVMIALAGGSALYAAELRRRRNDVLQDRTEPAGDPLPVHETDRAPVQPVDLDGFRARNDVERILQQLAQLRRPAA